MMEVSIVHIDPGRELKDHLATLDHGDIKIIAENTAFQVHSQYLAAVSPLLRHVLLSAGVSDVILLDGVRSEVLQSLVQLLYYGETFVKTALADQLSLLIEELEININTKSEAETFPEQAGTQIDFGVVESEETEYVVFETSEDPPPNPLSEELHWDSDAIIGNINNESQIFSDGIAGSHTDGSLPLAETEVGETKKRKAELLYRRMTKPKRPPRFESLPTPWNPVACKECDQVFTSYTGLCTHMLSHTNEKPFECEECGARFRQKSNLKTHQRTHSSEKKFVCETCGKGFKHKDTLKEHTYLHTGETPFVCNVCGKGFKQKKMLRTHCCAANADTAWPKNCDICGEQVKSNRALNSHMKTHTMICKYCDLVFDNIVELNRHTVTHKKETRQCNYCDAYFDDLVALNKHLMMHTDAEV